MRAQLPRRPCTRCQALPAAQLGGPAWPASVCARVMHTRWYTRVRTRQHACPLPTHAQRYDFLSSGMGALAVTCYFVVARGQVRLGVHALRLGVWGAARSARLCVPHREWAACDESATRSAMRALTPLPTPAPHHLARRTPSTRSPSPRQARRWPWS